MSIKEKEYLELFKKQSEQMLGWGDSEDWSNVDFEKLSELVFEKTGVNLSISTLKRVWGKVKYDSVPTATTLNTLAQFSGYDSWRSFCAQADQNTTAIGKTAVVQDTVIVKPKKEASHKWVVPAISAVLILISAFMWIGFFKPLLVIDPSKVVFTSRVISNELPNSVVFNYNIGNIKADSVIIQQSWDKNRREVVPAHQHQHTSIYYFPGFFKAKLIINNKIIKQHEVFIKTNGWKGFIDQSQSRPFYLSDNDIAGQHGSMKVDAQTLIAKTGKTVFNDIYTIFCNDKEFNINGNDFTLNTTLQNTSSKEEAICQQLQVNIVTSDGFIGLPLSNKGCTPNLQVNVGDIAINGKDNDLSAFGCDFSKPQDLRLTVIDKKAIIYLNQKPILTVPYTKPFGRLVGLRVTFEGTGEIKNIDVR